MSQAERRTAERKPFVEEFSLFVTLSDQPYLRLRIKDLSQSGLGFDVSKENPVEKGDRMSLKLFLNQSLFIPMSIEVMRVQEFQEDPSSLRVGARIVDADDSLLKAYESIVAMLDAIAPVVQSDKG